MKLLRIKDNSQQKKDVFSQVAKLTGKIADKTLEQLEREGVFVFPETVKDAEDITQDQMILQSVNDAYRSGNVMGFLGYGDERLVIESRFCGEGEDFFFQYLLDKVLDFPNVVDLESNANQDNRLFNFLLFLFPYYLKTAMRKGLFKKYIRCRYNDGNVKGTIDVARHIEKNIEQGELTLNGVTIPLNGASLSDLQERKKTLEYCKDVKKMLDYLGVTEELLLNDLSENDEKNLRNFTGAVLYNRKIGFPNMEQDQFYGAFKIANLVIWIWAKRQSDGMYSIDSFFKLHQIALFTDDDVDLKKPIQTSQFVLFDKKGLVHISNMDYELVYSDISQTPPSPEYCTKVNFLVLDMIGAYDEQAKHDEKLLNLAERICDWLKSIESMIDPEVLLLNKLQITKRRRTLSTSEIIELAKLTENSYPPATRCGAYLLMDADEEAQKCFDELPLIAQEEFLKYPICHFGKLTTKEDKTNG